MINTENKAKIMTIEEIRLYYPNEWVIIADTESDANFNVIRGQVLAHNISEKAKSETQQQRCRRWVSLVKKIGDCGSRALLATPNLQAIALKLYNEDYVGFPHVNPTYRLQE